MVCQLGSAWSSSLTDTDKCCICRLWCSNHAEIRVRSRFGVAMDNVSHDANPQGFHYHPLEDNEIRIWYLDPGDEADPISGTMYINDLEGSGKFAYNACSYCWGDLEDQEQIVVNGWPTEITKNLAMFLRRLRSLSTHRQTSLWIDRLCINQSDPQIPLMRSIYEKADQVLVWLGPAAAIAILPSRSCNDSTCF